MQELSTRVWQKHTLQGMNENFGGYVFRIGQNLVHDFFRKLLSPNYTSTTENATGILVAASNDNVNWVEQGKWNGTGPSATSSAAAPDIKGINFISPVKAQYFRFTIVSQASTTRVGMAEIKAVQ